MKGDKLSIIPQHVLKSKLMFKNNIKHEFLIKFMYGTIDIERFPVFRNIVIFQNLEYTHKINKLCEPTQKKTF